MKSIMFKENNDSEFDDSQSSPLLHNKKFKGMQIDRPSPSLLHAASIYEDILAEVELSNRLKTNTAAAVTREKNISIVQSQLASLRAYKKVAVLYQRRGSAFQNSVDSSASIAAATISVNLSMGSGVQMNALRDSHSSRLEGFRASIELNIMHAEKLMPAKKVFFCNLLVTIICSRPLD